MCGGGEERDGSRHASSPFSLVGSLVSGCESSPIGLALGDPISRDGHVEITLHIMTQRWIGRSLSISLFLASSPFPFSILVLRSLIDGKNDDEVLSRHLELVNMMDPPC